MKFIKPSNIKVDDIICVKEPDHMFSHDCYIFKGIKGNNCLLDMYNNDSDDGTRVLFPLDELHECQTWDPQSI